MLPSPDSLARARKTRNESLPDGAESGFLISNFFMKEQPFNHHKGFKPTWNNVTVTLRFGVTSLVFSYFCLGSVGNLGID